MEISEEQVKLDQAKIEEIEQIYKKLIQTLLQSQSLAEFAS